MTRRAYILYARRVIRRQGGASLTFWETGLLRSESESDSNPVEKINRVKSCAHAKGELLISTGAREQGVTKFQNFNENFVKNVKNSKKNEFAFYESRMVWGCCQELLACILMHLKWFGRRLERRNPETWKTSKIKNLIKQKCHENDRSGQNDRPGR